jgi:hypothetical protein
MKYDSEDEYGFFCDIENYNTIVTSVIMKEQFENGYGICMKNNEKYTNIIIKLYSEKINKCMVILSITSILLLMYQLYHLELHH